MGRAGERARPCRAPSCRAPGRPAGAWKRLLPVRRSGRATGVTCRPSDARPAPVRTPVVLPSRAGRRSAGCRREPGGCQRGPRPPSSLVPDMEQQEYATGAARTAGGTSDGRTGGAGRGTTAAVVVVRGSGPRVLPGAGVDAPKDAAPVRGSGSPSTAGLSPDPGLLRLARWFAEAEPGTADDLCAASLGLYPARHFGAPPARPPDPPLPDRPPDPPPDPPPTWPPPRRSPPRSAGGTAPPRTPPRRCAPASRARPVACAAPAGTPPRCPSSSQAPSRASPAATASPNDPGAPVPSRRIVPPRPPPPSAGSPPGCSSPTRW